METEAGGILAPVDLSAADNKLYVSFLLSQIPKTKSTQQQRRVMEELWSCDLGSDFRTDRERGSNLLSASRKLR